MLLPSDWGFPENLSGEEYYKLLGKLGDYKAARKISPTATKLRVNRHGIPIEVVQQQLEKAGYTLLMEIGAYWGHLLHQCKIVITSNAGTACVGIDSTDDTLVLAIAPDFFGNISDSDRVGILYHELQHVALGHLAIPTTPATHEQWNYANDLAINGPLVKVKPSVMTLPPCQSGEHRSNGQALSELDRKILERALRRAKDQTGHGAVPQCVEESLTALAKMAPKKWHAELRKFYRSTVEGIDRERTWSRPNRRYGLWEAGSKSGQGKKLVIGVDTSASMSQEEIQHILAECHSILKCGVEAQVMFFDTEVHNTIKLKANPHVEKCGRGGTDFKDFVTKAVRQKPDAIVLFSDMDAPDNLTPKDFKGVPILWVFAAGDKPAPGIWNTFGRKVILD